MRLVIKFMLIICLSISQNGFAQVVNKQYKKLKQIEAIKMGFISGRLNLTEQEADLFWPVYKKYQTELAQINIQKRERRLQNNSNPEKTIDDDFYFDTKLLEIKKKYRIEFSRILPPEKVKRLYVAERDFREELIKQLKNRNESR